MHNKIFMTIFRRVYLVLDLWISGVILNRKIDLFSQYCQLGTHRNSILHILKRFEMVKNQFMYGSYIESVFKRNNTDINQTKSNNSIVSIRLFQS